MADARNSTLARQALAATTTNVVSLMAPERPVPRRHLVFDPPIYYPGARELRDMTPSKFRDRVFRPYLIAERACEVRLREQVKTISFNNEVDWIDAFRNIQGAARTLRLMADVAESGANRMEAAMIDAGIFNEPAT